MDLFERLNTVFKPAIITALFSDDELMDLLVLKGGTALDLIHGAAMRGSVDIDLSMGGAFEKNRLEQIGRRVEQRIRQSLAERGLHLFDFSFREQPPTLSPDLEEFWGGYVIELKLIAVQRYADLQGDTAKLRRNAEVVGLKNGRKFIVEISKHECTADKVPWSMDGYRIYVYPPELIVAEKLRTICQQMEEYCRTMRREGRSRAKDFFDIHFALEKCRVNVDAPGFHDLIRRVFGAKRVPLGLLAEIAEEREKHRDSFNEVRDTVREGVEIEDHDFYFDSVLATVQRLESLWIEEPPAL